MGGRKKSSTKPATKRRPKLDAVFVCPKCSQEGAVATIIANKPGVARKTEPKAFITCPSCEASHSFSGNVSYLTQPIDVYSDWIDFVSNGGKLKKRVRMTPATPPTATTSRTAPRKVDDDDEEEEEEDILADAPFRSRKNDDEEEDDDEDSL